MGSSYSLTPLRDQTMASSNSIPSLRPNSIAVKILELGRYFLWQSTGLKPHLKSRTDGVLEILSFVVPLDVGNQIAGISDIVLAS